jgi:hypothetical protein
VGLPSSFLDGVFTLMDSDDKRPDGLWMGDPSTPSHRSFMLDELRFVVRH